jgi:hypothetical protein
MGVLARAVVVVVCAVSFCAGACKKKGGPEVSSEIAERHKRQIAYCESFRASDVREKLLCYDHLALSSREIAFCSRGSNSCADDAAGLAGGKWDACEGRRQPSATCFIRAAGAGGGEAACTALRGERDRLKKAAAAGPVNERWEPLDAEAPICDAVIHHDAGACLGLDGSMLIETCLTGLAIAEKSTQYCDRFPALPAEGRRLAIGKCQAAVGMATGDAPACISAGAPHQVYECRKKAMAIANAEDKDPALCAQDQKLNAHQIERCVLFAVSRGGDGAACETIKLQPELAETCRKIARM